MTDTDGALPLHVIAVGVGEYDDPGYPALHDAETDAEAIADLWRHLGATATVIRSGTVGELTDRLTEAFEDATEPALIVYWTGHGDPSGSATGGLSLIGRNSAYGKATTLKPSTLVEQALGTSAQAVLILVDTCFSGAALPSVTAAAADLLNQAGAASGDSTRWVGYVPAARAWEPAKASDFAGHLKRLFTHGPQHPLVVPRWSEHNRLLLGQDILLAIEKDWPETAGHLPVGTPVGPNQQVFPNPLWRERAPAQVVEHLIAAACGESTGERWYFTGRERAVARIVAEVRYPAPGVTVLTGPAGCGKSAVLGMVAAMSDEVLRASMPIEVMARYDDPGVGAVAGTIYARRMSDEQFAQALTGVITASTAPVPVVFVDGLDEVGAQVWEIAAGAIATTALGARVVIGTREVTRDQPSSDGPVVESLTDVLGAPDPAANVVHLDQVVDDVADVTAYVRLRLFGVDPAMSPGVVAAAIAALPQTEGEGRFLLARLLTGHLRANPCDTSQPGWEAVLDTSVEAALATEISGMSIATTRAVAPEQAVRDVLAGLAWTAGQGAPEDVVSVIATAVTDDERAYSVDDVYAVIAEAGRFIVQDGYFGRAVYRLAHARLADHLRGEVGTRHTTAARIVVALGEAMAEHLRAGGAPFDEGYLMGFLWRHAADAGLPGLDVMAGLFDEWPDVFEPGYGLAILQIGLDAGETSDADDRVATAKAQVEVFQRLSAHNPDHLASLAQSWQRLGLFLDMAGEPAQGVVASTQAVELFTQLAADLPVPSAQLADSYWYLATRLMSDDEPALALDAATEAVDLMSRLIAMDLGSTADLATYLRTVAQAHTALGDETSAYEAASEAAQLLGENGPGADPLTAALGLVQLAQSEMGRQSWDAAASALRQAISALDTVEAPTPTMAGFTVEARQNLAWVLVQSSHFEEALESADQGLRQAESLPPGHINPLLIALLFNAKAVSAAHVGDLETAANAMMLEIQILAEDRGRRSPDDPQPMVAWFQALGQLVNLAFVKHVQGAIDEALTSADQALTLWQALAETEPAARLYVGHALWIKGLVTGDSAYQSQAIEVWRALDPAELTELVAGLEQLGDWMTRHGQPAGGGAALAEAAAIRTLSG